VDAVNYVIPTGTSNPTPPDPAGLKFTAPSDVVFAADPRAAALAEWIEHARAAGHFNTEHLHAANPTLDLPLNTAATDRRHCGTARIGTDVLDVYMRVPSNGVYALRPGEATRRALLGLDEVRAQKRAEAGRVTRTAAELTELVERARKRAGDTAEPRGTVEGQALAEAEAGWVTRTAAELTELVERARNLLHTDVGNDIERDAVRDQADVLGIIAALLPAWADRGVHPATEDNVEMASARLRHLLDELES
jgi:hypothetical protein